LGCAALFAYPRGRATRARYVVETPWSPPRSPRRVKWCAPLERCPLRRRRPLRRLPLRRLPLRRLPLRRRPMRRRPMRRRRRAEPPPPAVTEPDCVVTGCGAGCVAAFLSRSPSIARVASSPPPHRPDRDLYSEIVCGPKVLRTVVMCCYAFLMHTPARNRRKPRSESRQDVRKMRVPRFRSNHAM
jgi:hypothetical protein